MFQHTKTQCMLQKIGCFPKFYWVFIVYHKTIQIKVNYKCVFLKKMRSFNNHVKIPITVLKMKFISILHYMWSRQIVLAKTNS